MTESGVIPIEQLELDRRRLVAKVLNVLVVAMAESNTTMDTADKRMGRAPGFTKGFISNLLNFEPSMMKEVSYMASAMSVEIDIGAQRVIPERPLVNRHIPLEDIDEYVWLFRTRAEWDALDPYTLVEVMDSSVIFHIGPKLSFNEDHVLRWKLYKPFEEVVEPMMPSSADE